MEIIIIIIVLKLISLAIDNSKSTSVDTNDDLKHYDFKCCSCGKYFNECEVMEWLDDNDEEDDCFGANPCCPYCGSSDVEENK